MGAARQVMARHRAVTGAAAGVLLLVCLSAGLSLASARDHRQWVASCQASGGSVESTPREHRNPLIRETSDPVQRCLGPAGQVLSER